MKKLGDIDILSQMMPGVSSSKPTLRFVLFLAAVTFIIFGLVNPQIGSKLEEIKREGSDIIICLDVSNSMKAEDFKPNRLAKAKQAIEKLIDKLNNDRLGIIVFAGEAYVQLPITTDYAAAKLFLENVDCDAVQVQGTVISSAIELAEKSFGTEEGKNKAIIIISDGESHDDDAIAAAKTASEKNITIHTIGIGSPEGVPIPVYKNNVQSGFRKDKEGNTVVTKLNETALEEIASAGNGVYLRASQGEIGLLSLQERINKMEKKTFDSKIYTDYEDRFQIFIAIALFFLLIESILTERKSKWWEKMFKHPSSILPKGEEENPRNRRNKKVITFFICASLLLPSLWEGSGMGLFAQTDEQKLVREGNKKYNDKKYSEAEKSYQNALGKQSNSYRGTFNLGDSYYKQGKYKEATEQFESLTARKSSDDTLSKVYHNLGNSYLKQKEFEKSINAYKNALKKNDEDDETRYNLAYAQRMLKQQQEQQKQQKKDQDKKDKDKKDDKNKDKKDDKNKDKKKDDKQDQQQSQNISKEDAQRLLEAMNNDEKKLRDKMNEKKVKVANTQIEKDW